MGRQVAGAGTWVGRFSFSGTRPAVGPIGTVGVDRKAGLERTVHTAKPTSRRDRQSVKCRAEQRLYGA
jgi:hypothetical protein